MKITSVKDIDSKIEELLDSKEMFISSEAGDFLVEIQNAIKYENRILVFGQDFSMLVKKIIEKKEATIQEILVAWNSGGSELSERLYKGSGDIIEKRLSTIEWDVYDSVAQEGDGWLAMESYKVEEF